MNQIEKKENSSIKDRRPESPMGGGPGRHGMGVVEKPKNFKATMKNLLRYIRTFWLSIILVCILSIASTVFAIIGPKVLGNMTNQIVEDYTNMMIYDQIRNTLPEKIMIPSGAMGRDLIAMMPNELLLKIPTDTLEKIKNMKMDSRPGMSYGKITYIAIWLIGLYLLSALLGYIQGWVMSGISQKISYKFRRDISEKINRMPLKYFDTKTYGEVLSRITNDVDTVGQTLNQSLTQIITSLKMIIGIFIMMLSISWQMTLVALITLPISLVLVGIILKKSQRYFKSQQDSLGEINGHIEEMYSGHNVVKVFNGEQRSIARFNKINKKLYQSGWKSQFLSGLMWPIMSFIGNLGYVGVAVLGGWLAINGRLKIGDIQAFIQYVQQFNQPIIQTANIANVMQSTAAAAERVFEFLNEEEEIAEQEDENRLSTVTGRIEFKDVVFEYVPGKPVIRGFNASIKPGQRVAIVGPTGAGKTTMVNLLMRFYDVTSGSISIDGVDIKQMKRSELRRMFGMVLQDTWLFSGSIRENITYGKNNASEDEIKCAVDAAHVSHFVGALPGGFNMVLNEESDNISQGEKQLLTIARAMLANPPMLILDEATSSVDTRTESLIVKAMSNLMGDKTSFVIAHRLSTIRDADLILVINNGNIVEQGKHNELLQKNGFYASLYNSQFVSSSQ